MGMVEMDMVMDMDTVYTYKERYSNIYEISLNNFHSPFEDGVPF